MTSIYKVKDQNDFDDQLELAGEKLVMVQFTTNWCRATRMVAKDFDNIADKFSNDVVFLRVDVEEKDCDKISIQYDHPCIFPTFVVIKNKKKLDDTSGINANRIRNLITNHK